MDKPSIALLFALVSVLFLASCDRAVEAVAKVSIQLPHKSVELKSVQILSDNEVNDEEKDNDFISLQPTDFSGAYPINCFAVVVTASDKGFSQNYCGKRDASNVLSHDIDFGPYAGLLSLGSSAELELSPGDARQFHILGFHAVDTASCKDISKNPEKYNLTKPYYLGSSELIDLKAGTSQDVVISLSNTQANSYYDECIISEKDSEDKYSYPDSIEVVNKAFPFSFLRNPSSGNFCEPMDVYLKDAKGRSAAFSQATLGNLQVANTSGGSFVAGTTYANNDDCSNNTGGTTSFLFLKNETMKRRWIRWGVIGDTTRYFKAVGGQLVSAEYTTTLNTNASQLIFDHFFPKKAMPDTCYKVVTNFRKPSGLLYTGSYSMSLAVTPAGAASFFNSLSNCQSNLGATSSVSTSDDNVVYYMKTANTNDVQVSVVGTASGVLSVQPVVFNITDKSGSSTDVKSLRFQARDYFNDNPSQCNPVFISLVNENGRVQIPSTAGTLKVLFDASKLAGINLYDDSNKCSSTALTASNSITVPAGAHYVKLYMSPINGTVTYVPHSIQVIYKNGSQTAIGRFKFDITNMNF